MTENVPSSTYPGKISFTVVASSTLLFMGFVSNPFPVTSASNSSFAGSVVWKTTSRVTVESLLSTSRSQVMNKPCSSTDPRLAADLIYLAWKGNVQTVTRFVFIMGPLLVRVRVYFRVSPSPIGSRESFAVSSRSDPGGRCQINMSLFSFLLSSQTIFFLDVRGFL